MGLIPILSFFWYYFWAQKISSLLDQMLESFLILFFLKLLAFAEILWYLLEYKDLC